jgi:hypothetical protein
MRRPKRRKILGAPEYAPASCWAETKRKPTIKQILKALTDPHVESAYFVEADLLVKGDMSCVPLEGQFLQGTKWFIHNHPIGSLPFPSNGDACTATALGARRMDIIGFDSAGRRVATTFRLRGDAAWPCESYRGGHAPAELDRSKIYFNAVAAEEYPPFMRGRKHFERWVAKVSAAERRLEAQRYPRRGEEAEERFSRLEFDDGPSARCKRSCR